MKTGAAPAPAIVAGILALAVAVAACSKDDTPKPPTQLGFVPPPGMNATAAPAPSGPAEQTAPAFTSYFDTLDSGPTRPSAAGLVQAAQNRPDPDVASREALRSRLNGCFPLANLAPGTSRNVAVTFTVIATGRVSRYDISGASSTDGAFYDCVHGIADGASFPERSTAAVPGGPPPVPEVRTIVVTAGATAS